MKPIYFLFLSLLFVFAVQSCKNQNDDTKPADTEQITKDDVAEEVNDTESATVTEEENKQSTTANGNFISVPGKCFNYLTLNDFMADGAGVYVDSKENSFDVIQLLEHASDPSKVSINGNGFHEFEILDFIIKGGSVTLRCPYFSEFEISSFIKEAKKYAFEKNITVIGCECNINDVLNYAQSGVKIKINKLQKPFRLLPVIEAGRERVSVYANGFKSNWIKEFIERGASVYADKSFDAFHLYEFVVMGQDRVTVYGKDMTLETLKRILEKNGKVIVGKFRKSVMIKDKNCSRRFKKLDGNFTAFEIRELITINPKNVTVIGDGFKPEELAVFMDKGANIIFRNCRPDCFELNTILNGIKPASNDNVAQETKKAKKKK